MSRKNPPTSSPPTDAPRDYVAIADAYARRAVADKRGYFTGELIRQACQRYLGDRQRAEDLSCAFYFDEWEATNPCDFIEKLPHVEGVWETPTITLHEAHVWFLVNLFGFRRRHNGTRRFIRALLAVARKNAKSTLAAAILLYCFCCEDEPGAQVITAATTYDQAAIIFKMAKAMLTKTPELAEAFGLQDWSKAITRPEIGGSFKALHAKASTQDGLNPSHVGLDEIHAHKTADLLNVLQSAAGARRSPLFLFTTTEGYETPGPWPDLRRYGELLLSGALGQEDHDHFLVAIYAVDKDDDDFNPDVWPKANPLWWVNEHLRKAVENEAAEAKQMPSKLAEFKIKRLNRRAAAANSWVDLASWTACAQAVALDTLKGRECYGGLDLASTGDITAFRLVWKLADGTVATWGIRWVPEEAVKQRTTRGTTPYASWVGSGVLRVTPGNVADYAIIQRDIVDWLVQFRPKRVCYDSWNSSDIVTRLMEADGHDTEFVQFVQGTKSYHPTIRELESLYLSGKLAHGGDPLLSWCAANLVTKTDDNLNMAPSKKKSADKIDDMTALLMALGASQELAEKEPDYTMHMVA
jgi:phage terminase large subunit-like protein